MERQDNYQKKDRDESFRRIVTSKKLPLKMRDVFDHASNHIVLPPAPIQAVNIVKTEEDLFPRQNPQVEYAFALNHQLKLKSKPQKGPIIRRIKNIPKLIPKSRKQNRKRSNQLHGAGDERAINAGVYMLRNVHTGHVYLGTSWDLRNAKEQNFTDLQEGTHAHAALVRSFQIYGEESSFIEFRILEQIKIKEQNRFEVKEIEDQLSKRLTFHRTKIWRKFAGKLVRKMFLLPLYRTFFLIWKEKIVYLEQSHEQMAAAVTIQSILRCFLAKKKVDLLRRISAQMILKRFFAFCMSKLLMIERKQIKILNNSAVVIQKLLKSFLYRRRHDRQMALLRKYIKSPLTIQRVYRGYCARKYMGQLKSSLLLQRIGRGFLARRRVEKILRTRHENVAAIDIQCVWKGYHQRQHFKIIRAMYLAQQAALEAEIVAKEKARLELMAKTVEVAYAKYWDRKKRWGGLTLLKEFKAVRKIQKWYHRRKFWHLVLIAAAKYRKEKYAAIQIQRIARGMVKRKWYHHLRQKVCHLQRWWRVCLGWKHLMASWAEHKRRRYAALVIQCTWRMYYARQVRQALLVKKRHKMAIRIQCWWKCILAREIYKRKCFFRHQYQQDHFAVCHECMEAFSKFYCEEFFLALCSLCRLLPSYVFSNQMEIEDFRKRQHATILIQRVWRGYNLRLGIKFGFCHLCHVQAVREICLEKPPALCRHQTFCHSCCEAYHLTISRVLSPKAKAKKHEVYKIEIFKKLQVQSAFLIARNWRAWKIYIQWRQRIQDIRKKLREELEFKKAKMIQLFYRHFYRRWKWKTTVREVLQQEANRKQKEEEDRLQRAKEHLAIALIQKYARGVLARIEYRRQKELRRLQLEAEELERQRLWELQQIQFRSIWVQVTWGMVLFTRARRICMIRLYQKQTKAAIKIQSIWRGFYLRKQGILKKKRQFRDAMQKLRHFLMICVAQFRLKKLRKQRQIRIEKEAAIKIQNTWRSFKAIKELNMLRLKNAHKKRIEAKEMMIIFEINKVSFLQRIIRSKLSFRHKKIILIQKHVRKWLLLRHIHRQTAAMRIQRVWRYMIAKVRLQEVVGTLQKAVEEEEWEWVELFDESKGCCYYFNIRTQESTWTPPEGSDFSIGWDQPGDFVQNSQEWIEYWDENVGACYYYNIHTGEATWTPPDSFLSATTDSSSSPPSMMSPMTFEYSGIFGTAPISGKFGKSTGNHHTKEENRRENIGGMDGIFRTAPPGIIDDKKAAQMSDTLASNQHHEDDPATDTSAVDTEYDINYKIYMTQLERERQRLADTIQQEEIQEHQQHDQERHNQGSGQQDTATMDNHNDNQTNDHTLHEQSRQIE